MTAFQWALVGTSLFVVLLIVVIGFVKKWSVDRVANLMTIFGVALAVALVIRVSPELVSVEQRPEVFLHSFGAQEWA